jgi:four helix bundle protein
LVAWQETHQLTLSVYKVTASFPTSERYGLTSQLRRAAFSVTANLVEGSAKRGPAEFRRFLDISLGSMAEVTYGLELARELNLIEAETWTQLEDQRKRAGFLLWRLYRAVSGKKR